MENSKTENMTNTAEEMKNAESAVNAVRYEDAPIDERIIRAVQEMGFEVMTPIQQQAIPALLEGRDVLGQAQTGTGKTAAFGIPMIQRIDPEVEGVQCIILCPTRELAIQAAEELRKFAKFMHGIKFFLSMEDRIYPSRYAPSRVMSRLLSELRDVSWTT